MKKLNRKKLRTIVYLLNAMSLSYVCVTIISQLGISIGLKLAISIIIITSTNFAASIQFLFPEKENDNGESDIGQ